MSFRSFPPISPGHVMLLLLLLLLLLRFKIWRICKRSVLLQVRAQYPLHIEDRASPMFTMAYPNSQKGVLEQWL